MRGLSATSGKVVIALKKSLACLLLLCLLLTACVRGESPLQPAVDFRAGLISAGGCTFRAEVRADFGSFVQDFVLDCDVRSDGTARLCVVSPETIAGICATVTESGGKLEYDGLALDFGLLANGNISPVAAPALVAAGWMEAFISTAGADGEYYHTLYLKNYDEKEILIDTWMKKGVPFCAELCYNGQRVMRMNLSDFKLH